jgi:hypothetical protein
MAMPTLSLPVAQLIRENASILMMYAFSRAAIRDLFEKTFEGEWQDFRETVFDFSDHRAQRACLELAILLRYVDEEHGVSKTLKTQLTFGSVHYSDGSQEDLSLREVANKIIHAAAFEWDLSRPLKPMLVCLPRDKQRWQRATIELVAVVAVCGRLIV